MANYVMVRFGSQGKADKQSKGEAMQRRAILGVMMLALAGCEKKTEPPKAEVKSEPTVNPVISPLAAGSKAIIFTTGKDDTYLAMLSIDGNTALTVPVGIEVSILADPGGVRDDREVKILIPGNSGVSILGGDDGPNTPKPFHVRIRRSMLRPIP